MYGNRHSSLARTFSPRTFTLARNSAARLAAFLMAVALGSGAVSATAQLTLRVQEFATMPVTGSPQYPSSTANSAYLARGNFLAEEPGNSDRFFVNDLNGPLYILDKTSRRFTSYLDFNGRDGRPGLFDKFTFDAGFANGLITFQFDPGYASNGKFYTVHMEEPNVRGSLVPDNSSYPDLDTAGYSPTTSVDAPGGPNRQTVLIEWTDTDITNATFEGTARELLRLDMVSRIHPLGDLIFNPLASPGDPDWRVMYLAVGDGGAGEQGNTDIRRTPQRLDALAGKILRIVPDLDEHTQTSTVSDNGRYRIPSDNPYASLDGARDELWAVGLRNPHRVSWDVDPATAENNHLIANDIGLHTWEEVNIIHPGRNYGYSEREGNERLRSNNSTTSLPAVDEIPIRIDGTTTAGTTVPTYPVVQYSHDSSDPFFGDSITSGYVYRGSRIPELYGKYIFGDITTGQLFYADYDEVLAADDGDPQTLAELRTIQLLWDDPHDAPDSGQQLYESMFPIVDEYYHFRGGQDPNLPGSAALTFGQGRADIRLQVDEGGELYVLSKSDGMIRAVFAPNSGVPGDYNNNGRTEQADLDLVLLHWGAAVATLPIEWNNERPMSGILDQAELDGVLLNWGAATSGVGRVPEPSSRLLVVLGIAGLVLFKNRSQPREPRSVDRAGDRDRH